MRAFAFTLLMGLVLAGCATPATAQPPAGVALVGPAGQAVTLTAGDLAGGARRTVRMTIHGTEHVFEGVLLADVLERVGAPRGPALRGEALADVVLISCADGYRVALSLGEIDPALRTDAVVLLADRDNGAALPAEDGPFRLVVAGDQRPARSARQVTRIEVRALR